MIIGILGLEGTGKTMLGVIIATIRKSQGAKIVSNVKTYKYNDYDFEKDFLFLIERTKSDRKKKPDNYLVFIDEIAQYLDARNSMRPINKKLTLKLMQIRKYGMDMIYTAQLLMSADIRLRKLTDTFLMPEYDKYKMTLSWKVVDVNGNSVDKKSITVNESIYKLYDTYEDIDNNMVILKGS